eukprot:Em0015g708a
MHRSKYSKENQHHSESIEQKGNTLVHDVLVKEWEKMQTENSTLQKFLFTPQFKPPSESSCEAKTDVKPFDKECFDPSDDNDIEYVLSIVEELTQELMLEEERILAQHEQNTKLSEEALCAAIECLATSDVICPVCQKDVLHQNKHIIFCSCGVRLDTAQDGVTLSYIQKQLEECCAYHSGLCCGKPVFSLEDTVGIQNIIMNCSVCDHMDIII